MAKLVWSQLLPRANWRFSNNVRAMEKVRRRINRYGASTIIRLGGGYIEHQALVASNLSPEFYDNDGVHLSELGNDLFLAKLRAGVARIGNH